MKRFLTSVILLLAGTCAGWMLRPYVDHIRDYGEAERMQRALDARGEPPKLAPDVGTYAGKLVLQDVNGDRIIIVNGGMQLRMNASLTFPIVEKLGSSEKPGSP